MPAADIAVRPVLVGAGAILLLVTATVAVVLALLSGWHEPAGGQPSGAAALVPALQAIGPALQSAPQPDHAAYLAQKAHASAAASEASR